MTERAVRFVLLSHHYCGEAVLQSCLAGHPRVKMYGELFHPSESCREDNAGPGNAPYRIGEDGRAYLAGHGFRLRANSAARAVGFAMAYGDARVDRFIATAWDFLIENQDIRVLHLTRSNLLMAHLASEVAERIPGWLDPFDPRQSHEVEPFSLPGSACREALDRLITLQMWGRQAFAGHPFLELDYEKDIIGDFRGAMLRACKFIGVDPTDPRFEIPSPTPRPQKSPAEQLINFAELQEDFRCSPYEAEFQTEVAGASR